MKSERQRQGSLLAELSLSRPRPAEKGDLGISTKRFCFFPVVMGVCTVSNDACQCRNEWVPNSALKMYQSGLIKRAVLARVLSSFNFLFNG